MSRWPPRASSDPGPSCQIAGPRLCASPTTLRAQWTYTRGQLQRPRASLVKKIRIAPSSLVYVTSKSDPKGRPRQ